jgi:hypothetical protein
LNKSKKFLNPEFHHTQKILKFLKIGIISILSICIMTNCHEDDPMYQLDNGVILVKVDPNAGGAIGYISESGSTYNVVNVRDLGRYIQQSYYAGEDLDRRCEGQHETWSPWCWNPIQAGDTFGNSAEILDTSNDGTTLYVKTRPRLWDMNGEYGECEFENWITLDGTSIHVRNKVVIHRTDNIWTQVLPKGQELPAVYTIADFQNLYTYTGSNPWTNDVLTKIPNLPPPWSFWDTSEHWAAYVNDDNWGLGVYNKSVTRFIGGATGTSGGPHHGSTGYISPIGLEAFGKNAVYEYEYDLILGDLNTIRAFVYQNR